jgi:tetratricopeptide (TPR) repeat protein
MTEKLAQAKELIGKGEVESAINILNQCIADHKACSDEPYYLLGNAYRKQGNWQMALNNYLEAIEKNPESPAVNAKKMLMDILEFYNKDMYNQ